MASRPPVVSGLNVALTTQFFAYLPATEPDSVELQRLRGVLHDIGYTTLRNPTLLGFVPTSPDESPTDLPLDLLHVTPGTGFAIASLPSKLAPGTDLKRFAGDELRLFNLISCQEDSLQICSDPLGVLPYYWAKLPDGLVVCSSVRHILQAFPHLFGSLDDQGAFEFLCCGTPFANRTLHKGIRLASAGQVIRWRRRRGADIDRRERISVAAPDPTIATTTAADQIAALIQESLQKLPSPAVLPLTGGFDSRLIAGFAMSLKLNPRMVSMGYGSHDEIKVARALANLLGTKTKVFAPHHRSILDLLPLWLECSAGLADAQALFLANLIYLPEPDGAPVYHGFIGDTLSGARLNAFGLEQAKTLEETAFSVANNFFSNISPRAPETLRLSASLEQVREDILGELIPNAAPYQAFVAWNLETMQRRFVGQQFLYIGKRLMPAPVFYYKPLMELWLSQPRMALDFRTLLGQIFRRCFPNLVSLPHSEHVPQEIPRTIPSLKYVLGWMGRSYSLKALRKLKFNTERLENRAYIWSMWHGMTPKERELELQRLEETFSLLESRLGWNAPLPVDTLWNECASTRHRQLLLLRRMHLLGEYAESLPDASVAAAMPGFEGEDLRVRSLRRIG